MLCAAAPELVLLLDVAGLVDAADVVVVVEPAPAADVVLLEEPAGLGDVEADCTGAEFATLKKLTNFGPTTQVLASSAVRAWQSALSTTQFSASHLPCAAQLA